MSESSLMMDALTLKKLYEFQLEGDLQPPVASHVAQRETFYMLRVSRGMHPGTLCEDEHAGIWIWSDLHLGHNETIQAFGRPFETAAEMDDKIFWNWRRVVAPEDTILILGDVTVHPLWGRRLKRVRQAPGRKILVYGNHEITRAGSVDNDGFDEVYSTLYVDGDPPLLLTHVPLRVVPEGCVNVHGHLHQRPRARTDATYQRLRRAAPLPAQGSDGGAGARPAPRHRRHPARPHDGSPAGSGALTDLPEPVPAPCGFRFVVANCAPLAPQLPHRRARRR